MSKIKGPKKQLAKSCSKLKKRHPQSIKRTTTMHPQGLETMIPTQNEEQVKE